jgi:hypothetical protein
LGAVKGEIKGGANQDDYSGKKANFLVLRSVENVFERGYQRLLPFSKVNGRSNGTLSATLGVP